MDELKDMDIIFRSRFKTFLGVFLRFEINWWIWVFEDRHDTGDR